jgi:hypothetical protein
VCAIVELWELRFERGQFVSFKFVPRERALGSAWSLFGTLDPSRCNWQACCKDLICNMPTMRAGKDNACLSMVRYVRISLASWTELIVPLILPNPFKLARDP